MKMKLSFIMISVSICLVLSSYNYVYAAPEDGSDNERTVEDIMNEQWAIEHMNDNSSDSSNDNQNSNDKTDENNEKNDSQTERTTEDIMNEQWAFEHMNDNKDGASDENKSSEVEEVTGVPYDEKLDGNEKQNEERTTDDIMKEQQMMEQMLAEQINKEKNEIKGTKIEFGKSVIKSKYVKVKFSFKADTIYDGYQIKVSIDGGKYKSLGTIVNAKELKNFVYKYKTKTKDHTYKFKIRGYKKVNGKKTYTKWYTITI